MKLVEKNNDKAEPVHMGWDAAQSAMAAGTHVLAAPEGVRIEDQPAAQSPAPGTDPFDPKKAETPVAPVAPPAPAPAPAPVAPSAPEKPAPAPAK